MLISDKFIFVHLPKTGGTFVTDVIRSVYKQNYKSLPFLQKFNYILDRKSHGLKEIIISDLAENESFSKSQHGTCNDIPFEFLNSDRIILSVFRNIFDRYVSIYKFRWWARYPAGDINDIKKIYHNFPNLSFKEFIDYELNYLTQNATKHLKNDFKYGRLTWQFLYYFFKHPEETSEKISDSFFDSGEYLKDMYKVNFLSTEKLNHDLYHFLLNLGYNKDTIKFILTKNKIYPKEGGRINDSWIKYYDNKLMSKIKEKEKFLFNLFPEYENF